MSRDVLPRTLEALFSYNPPLRAQPPGQQLEKRLVGTEPFNFYDRHVNEQQALKRVILLPSLVDDLVQSVDDCLSELKRRGEGPRPATYGGHFANTLQLDLSDGEVGPSSISNYYAVTVARTCLAMTSTWVIHPRTMKYYSVLRFDHGVRAPPQRRDAVYEHHSLRIAPFDKIDAEVLLAVDDHVKGALKDLTGRSLATWLFLPFAPHTETILRNMDQMAGSPITTPAICSTTGLPVTREKQPQTRDAKSSSWTLPISNAVASDTSDDYPVPQIQDECVSPGPSISQRHTEFEKMQDSTPEGLAHHAWQRAVCDDTTVIVFNCGNHERIGIRHRATQTLYLSETINVTQHRPSYGKLHLGLQMSIMKDVFDRYQQLETPPSPVIGKRSRKAGDNAGLREKSKRQRMDLLRAKAIGKTLLSKRDTEILWDELGKRHVALVRLCEGHLRSPVPAFCVRKGSALSPHGVEHVPRARKKNYQSFEYLTLTLDSVCGTGATAAVHTAKLQIVLPNGRTLNRGVVVKIATSEETKKRIRHEFNVYKHLWAHPGVKRIPEVYGLFEDVDNLATILVLERACYSFREREPVPINAVGCLQEVTPEEKATCIATLKAIHRAGVIHRDLRPDNIAIAQDRKPLILDFDRARFNATDEAKHRDMMYLNDVLDGFTTRVLVTETQ